MDDALINQLLGRGGTQALPTVGGSYTLSKPAAAARSNVELDLCGGTIALVDAPQVAAPTSTIHIAPPRGMVPAVRPLTESGEITNLVPFTDMISQWATVLHVGGLTAGLAPGRWIWLQLGVAPYDAHEADWCGFVRLTAVDGRAGMITIDRPIPWPIHGQQHYLSPDAPLERIVIKNGVIKSLTGSGSQMSGIHIDNARRVVLRDLCLDGPGITLSRCEHVSIDNVSIVNNFNTEVGFYLWRSRLVRIDNVSWVGGVRLGYDGSVVPRFISIEGCPEGVSVAAARCSCPIHYLPVAMDAASKLHFGTLVLEGGLGGGSGWYTEKDGNAGFDPDISVEELHLFTNPESRWMQLAGARRIYSHGVRVKG